MSFLCFYFAKLNKKTDTANIFERNLKYFHAISKIISPISL